MEDISMNYLETGHIQWFTQIRDCDYEGLSLSYAHKYIEYNRKTSLKYNDTNPDIIVKHISIEMMPI